MIRRVHTLTFAALLCALPPAASAKPKAKDKDHKKADPGAEVDDAADPYQRAGVAEVDDAKAAGTLDGLVNKDPFKGRAGMNAGATTDLPGAEGESLEAVFANELDSLQADMDQSLKRQALPEGGTPSMRIRPQTKVDLKDIPAEAARPKVVLSRAKVREPAPESAYVPSGKAKPSAVAATVETAVGAAKNTAAAKVKTAKDAAEANATTSSRTNAKAPAANKGDSIAAEAISGDAAPPSGAKHGKGKTKTKGTTVAAEGKNGANPKNTDASSSNVASSTGVVASGAAVAPATAVAASTADAEPAVPAAPVTSDIFGKPGAATSAAFEQAMAPAEPGAAVAAKPQHGNAQTYNAASVAAAPPTTIEASAESDTDAGLAAAKPAAADTRGMDGHRVAASSDGFDLSVKSSGGGDALAVPTGKGGRIESEDELVNSLATDETKRERARNNADARTGKPDLAAEADAIESYGSGRVADQAESIDDPLAASGIASHRKGPGGSSQDSTGDDPEVALDDMTSDQAALGFGSAPQERAAGSRKVFPGRDVGGHLASVTVSAPDAAAMPERQPIAAVPLVDSTVVADSADSAVRGGSIPIDHGTSAARETPKSERKHKSKKGKRTPQLAEETRSALDPSTVHTRIPAARDVTPHADDLKAVADKGVVLAMNDVVPIGAATAPEDPEQDEAKGSAHAAKAANNAKRAAGSSRAATVGAAAAAAMATATSESGARQLSAKAGATERADATDLGDSSSHGVIFGLLACLIAIGLFGGTHFVRRKSHDLDD